MSELLATFGIDWKLLLAQAVNFGIVLLALWYFLYRPVLGMIDERRKRIEEGVRNAEEADTRLKETKAAREEIVGKAAQEAERVIAEAKGRAEEKGSEVLHSAQERADSVLKDAADRAEELQRQALKESEKEIAKAAMLAAEKVIRERASA